MPVENRLAKEERPLTDDELTEVSGGFFWEICEWCYEYVLVSGVVPKIPVEQLR